MSFLIVVVCWRDRITVLVGMYFGGLFCAWIKIGVRVVLVKVDIKNVEERYKCKNVDLKARKITQRKWETWEIKGNKKNL